MFVLVANLANTEGPKSTVARDAYEDMSVCVYADVERNDREQKQTREKRRLQWNRNNDDEDRKVCGRREAGRSSTWAKRSPSGVKIDEEEDMRWGRQKLPKQRNRGRAVIDVRE